MRTLAIDLGTRRVGLALSDAGGKLATPLDTLQVRSPSDAISQIVKIVEFEGPERLLVGVPLNMDGTFGPAAAGAMGFARELESLCGKPVVFVDERLSTFEAEQQLTERKRAGEHLTRQKKKKRLDAHAAAILLQAFLDGRVTPLVNKPRP